jgi:hypothetical protein
MATAPTLVEHARAMSYKPLEAVLNIETPE